MKKAYNQENSEALQKKKTPNDITTANQNDVR